ncbi:Clavaminate synthase-like protein [Rickenella mellea]|uniref:Clavaminate synthase-like protein n=1 Tax=Rickenella mellea TaxID=50990 RepID=A0A4Y7QJT6_9AGAM|nr:Clavaminate synthase-like protein [Rickenella mellea]
MHDEHDNNAQRWAMEKLLDVVDSLSDEASTLRKNVGDYSAVLSKLVHDAHGQIRSHNHRSVPLCWRRLYTEASVVWSLLDLATRPEGPEALWRDAISRLDLAIVVAGAPGEGRLDLIIDAIERIQTTHLSFQTIHQVHPVTGVTETRTVQPLSSAYLPVPCLSKAPSLIAFRSTYSQAPFILRGFISEWPAASIHPWASKNYLRTVAGRGRVVPVEVGVDYRADDWTQKMMEWDDFLDYLLPNEPPQCVNANKVVYLAQHDLFKQFPSLRGDIVVPDYVYASLPSPVAFPKYQPPGNDDGLVCNVWLGPKGTISPAHIDPFFNFYAQVVGRKTVWLAPPYISAFMSAYTGSTSDTLAHPHNPAMNQTDGAMSNTSRIDVFADHTSSSNASEDIAAFRREVIPQAMRVTLEPGDLLFFPPGWWHAMRSEDTSFSVSMWF